ncbi:MAG: hypothetical protein VYA49_01095 [Planctomycetota bacterium]|nr:hypothetical protein [Planctomycetota bacterium]
MTKQSTRNRGRLFFTLCFVTLAWNVSDVFAQSIQDMVFEDDFSDGSTRWETTDSDSWTLTKQNGRAAWGLNKRKSDYQPKVRSPHNIALVRDLDLTDTVIEFDVKSTRDTGNHRDCCVFFQYKDPEHFYYVHLGAKPDPHSGQIMIVNGAPRRALTKNKNLVPWDDQWHHVRVERNTKSGKIVVFFDDMKKPIMEAYDKTFTSGRVGIGSFDDMNDFSHVKIYGQRASTEQ